MGSVATIIVATKNSARTLERCLLSIRNQTVRGFELVVADGGSTDCTMDIVSSFSDIVTASFSAHDNGVYDAWNKALRVSSGDWLLFLGADDVLAGHDVLESAFKALALAEDACIVSFPLDVCCTRRGSRLHRSQSHSGAARALRKGRMPVPHPSAWHRRSLLESVGGFSDHYRIAGDLHLFLGLLPDDFVFVSNPTLVIMAVGGLSTHPKTVPLKLREIVAARRGNGYPAFFPSDAAPFGLDVLRYLRYLVSQKLRPLRAVGR